MQAVTPEGRREDAVQVACNGGIIQSKSIKSKRATEARPCARPRIALKFYVLEEESGGIASTEPSLRRRRHTEFAGSLVSGWYLYDTRMERVIPEGHTPIPSEDPGEWTFGACANEWRARGVLLSVASGPIEPIWGRFQAGFGRVLAGFRRSQLRPAEDEIQILHGLSSSTEASASLGI